MMIINVSLRRNEDLKNPEFFVVSQATTKTIEGPQKGGQERRAVTRAWRHPLERGERGERSPAGQQRCRYTDNFPIVSGLCWNNYC